jgi:hypothetical protein
MLEDQLWELIDATLSPLGFQVEPGEEFTSPPLDVLRYYARSVRLHWFPGLGRARGVVAVARQPVDVGSQAGDSSRFLERVTMAVNGRFAPGLASGLGPVGLTIVALTPEPIAPEDDTRLAETLKQRTRSRVIPLGILRLNLGQEAMALGLSGGPDGLFPEPIALADAFTTRFRRFVPLLEPG